ncbi:hypothetical protein [Streptomyces africanus]|uniref:hypothetical protein n=1 Tax=Streptomyces africanus TaxID=231024 RepID=UPI0027D850ED|nr:hypothetical protein [Streptomyces africanus]
MAHEVPGTRAGAGRPPGIPGRPHRGAHVRAGTADHPPDALDPRPWNSPGQPGFPAILREAGVLFGPGQGDHAGGVATSALDKQQNAIRRQWTFEETEKRLAFVMSDIHTLCRENADRYGGGEGYVLGRERGWFPAHRSGDDRAGPRLKSGSGVGRAPSPPCVPVRPAAALR